jgi:hypothetical protein
MNYFIFHYMEYDDGQAIRDGFHGYVTPDDETIHTLNVDKLITFVHNNIVQDCNAAITIHNIFEISEELYKQKGVEMNKSKL